MTQLQHPRACPLKLHEKLAVWRPPPPPPSRAGDVALALFALCALVHGPTPSAAAAAAGHVHGSDEIYGNSVWGEGAAFTSVEVGRPPGMPHV
jgi:hypothetical protein